MRFDLYESEELQKPPKHFVHVQRLPPQLVVEKIPCGRGYESKDDMRPPQHWPFPEHLTLTWGPVGEVLVILHVTASQVCVQSLALQCCVLHRSPLQFNVLVPALQDCSQSPPLHFRTISPLFTQLSHVCLHPVPGQVQG